MLLSLFPASFPFPFPFILHLHKDMYLILLPLLLDVYLYPCSTPSPPLLPRTIMQFPNYDVNIRIPPGGYHELFVTILKQFYTHKQKDLVQSSQTWLLNEYGERYQVRKLFRVLMFVFVFLIFDLFFLFLFLFLFFFSFEWFSCRSSVRLGYGRQRQSIIGRIIYLFHLQMGKYIHLIFIPTLRFILPCILQLHPSPFVRMYGKSTCIPSLPPSLPVSSLPFPLILTAPPLLPPFQFHSFSHF